MGRASNFSGMREFVRTVPEGDDRERLVCPECGHVDYQNPRIIVGSVVSHEGRVLLCRRAIEPRKGFWTLPAGFLELGQTAQDGAVDEAREEAEAAILPDGILALFSISRIGQVQIIFRARFDLAPYGRPGYRPGRESMAVDLFHWNNIPWDRIAFASVHWSLAAWRANPEGPIGAPVGNPAEDPRGMQELSAHAAVEGVVQ
jgi:ADP-ribose pyrophosphatase YjhB (NUDIX family)